MAVSLVAVVVLGSLAFGRGKVPPEVIARAEASASSSAAASRSAVEARVEIAVIGDSYTSGSRMDSGPGARWPARLNAAYPWDFADFAIGGTGYLNRGTGDFPTFVERVPEVVAAQPEVVIVEGGHNDTGFPVGDVQAAAAEVLDELRTGLPDAQFIVVGVIWPGQPPLLVQQLNQGLQIAATQAGAYFVNPLAEGWFQGESQALIGEDGTHPTDDGHAFLADRFAANLIQAGLPETV